MLVVLGILLASCFRNGDDIGDFYGSWIVQEVEADGKVIFDGQEASDRDEVYSWRFQNDIVQLTQSTQYQDFAQWTGYWQETSTGITVEIPFQESFTPPFCFTNRVNVEITQRSSHHMTWQYIGSDGEKCVMKIKKPK